MYQVQNDLFVSPYCGAETPQSVDLDGRRPRFVERASLAAPLVCSGAPPQNTKEFLCLKATGRHPKVFTEAQLRALSKKPGGRGIPYRTFVFPGLQSVAIIFEDDFPAVIFFAKMYMSRTPEIPVSLARIFSDLRLDNTMSCQWKLICSKWQYQFVWPLSPRSIYVCTECWFSHMMSPSRCASKVELPSYTIEIMPQNFGPHKKKTKPRKHGNHRR